MVDWCLMMGWLRMDTSWLIWWCWCLGMGRWFNGRSPKSHTRMKSGFRGNCMGNTDGSSRLIAVNSSWCTTFSFLGGRGAAQNSLEGETALAVLPGPAKPIVDTRHCHSCPALANRSGSYDASRWHKCSVDRLPWPHLKLMTFGADRLNSGKAFCKPRHMLRAGAPTGWGSCLCHVDSCSLVPAWWSVPQNVPEALQCGCGSGWFLCHI